MPTPDIEIYLQRTSRDAVIGWLAARFPASANSPTRPAGKKQWRLVLQDGDHPVPVLIIEDASPGFTSVWFNSPHTPWPDDRACAREAQAHFHNEVRATAGSWQEGDDPDLWWRINDEGEGLMQWPD